MANLNELRDALRGQPATFLRDCMIAILDDVSGLVASREIQRGTLMEHHARLSMYTDQLAGLQRLVESLVNERGDGITTGCEPRLKHEIGQLRRDAIRIRDEREGAVHLAAEANRERDQLRAEVERLTTLAESRWKWAHDVAGVAESQTVEAIATWLERAAEAATIPTGNPARPFTPDSAARSAALVRAADGIRAGEWKP